MESVQDFFNSKISSLKRIKENLMTVYDEFEKERVLALCEVEITKKSAQSDLELVKTCEIAEVILEKLRLNISNLEYTEDVADKRQHGSQERNSNRKCRYYNRGFCKFEQKCKFGHPKLVCEEYVQDGLCLEKKCPKRHPRHCRYWANTPEGCSRNENCQYLHVTTKRFCNIEKKQQLSTVIEDDNEDVTVSCDQCDFVSNDNYHWRKHTKTLHEEVNYSGDSCQYRSKTKESPRTHKRPMVYGQEEKEEHYFVTRDGDAKLQFVCKKCKASFASQIAIKLHVRAEHRPGGSFY